MSTAVHRVIHCIQSLEIWYYLHWYPPSGATKSGEGSDKVVAHSLSASIRYDRWKWRASFEILIFHIQSNEVPSRTYWIRVLTRARTLTFPPSLITYFHIRKSNSQRDIGQCLSPMDLVRTVLSITLSQQSCNKYRWMQINRWCHLKWTNPTPFNDVLVQSDKLCAGSLVRAWTSLVASFRQILLCLLV